MGAIGIVRKVDELGRIVIPKETCRTLEIEQGVTGMEIFVGENNEIILKKYEPGCIFCEEVGNTKLFKGKQVCSKCIEGMKNL